jgi:ribosomal protein L18
MMRRRRRRRRRRKRRYSAYWKLWENTNKKQRNHWRRNEETVMVQYYSSSVQYMLQNVTEDPYTTVLPQEYVLSQKCGDTATENPMQRKNKAYPSLL